MTVKAVCRLALSFLSQTPEESEEIMAFSPGFLSLLCAESLDVENSIRRKNHQPLLTEAPSFQQEDMEKEVGYSDVLCRIALPYGLAAFYYADDDNDYRAAEYRARYVAALMEAQKMQTESIQDVYEGAV